MSENNHRQEELLLELVKEKQEADKRLLKVEITLWSLTCFIFSIRFSINSGLSSNFCKLLTIHQIL